MIEQELYIEILELFDLVEQEDIFIKYKKLEEKLTEDKKVCELVNMYNKLNEELVNIYYQPFVEKQQLRIDEINKELEELEEYNIYNKLYFECNERLNFLSSLIFKDVINVGKECCCESKQG